MQTIFTRAATVVKKLFFIGLGCTAAFLVSLPLAEFSDTNTYNLFHIHEPSGLQVYTPNTDYFTSSSCYESTVHVNNIGFHGRDVAVEKAKNVFRILILGGSYIEAPQMQVDDMYASLLEDKLNAIPNRSYTYEVVPIGVHQNSSLRNTLYYHWFGSPLKPDLVINMETPFELVGQLDSPSFDEKGAMVLTLPNTQPAGTVAEIKDALHHFKLFINLYARAVVFKSNVSAFLKEPLFFMKTPAVVVGDPAGESARWEIKNKIMDTFVGLVKKDNAKFLLATYMIEDTASSTLGELSRHYQELSTRYHFPHVDITAAMESAATKEDSAVQLVCDMHWSKDGNRYAADALYQYLATHPALITH